MSKISKFVAVFIFVIGVLWINSYTNECEERGGTVYRALFGLGCVIGG